LDSSSKNDQLEARLKRLKQAYAAELPTLLKRLQGFFGKVVDSGAKDREALSEVFRLAHSLTGSGPSFGFHRLGEMAQELEILTDQVLNQSESWDQKVSSKAAALLREIRDAALQPEPEEPVRVTRKSVSKAEHVKGKQPIAWIGPAPETSQQMREWLALFDLATNYYPTPQAFLKTERPDQAKAVIVDLSLSESSLKAMLDDLQSLSMALKQVPIIYLLPEKLDLSQQLLAYENGANACFSRPFNFLEMVTELDKVIVSEGEGPFRLLIVEDDAVLAEHIATIMRKAGLEVAVLSDPLGIEEVLDTFKPELILMDLYLGSCSGNSLAKLVRQREAFMNIPIVYISTETELAKRLEAFEVGADDFLLKPVKYHYLYYTLHSRMKRSRLLQLNLTRDSLTGLLDHGSIRQKLADSVNWALESGEPLTFAVIDLDRIGEVNAALGSKGGDGVLKTLAMLLNRNVRGKGWAGRYGGKEFSLILPHLNPEQARAFLDHLRKGFADIVHGRQWIQKGIQTSFSVGLAEVEEGESPGRVAMLALKALRQAQANGGNNIVVASHELHEEAAKPKEDAQPSFTPEDDEMIFFVEEDEDQVSGSPPAEDLSGYEEVPIPDLGLSVVVVDDEKQILEWVKSQLESLGYQVWTALTGEKGYDLLVEHKPDFLLADLLLFPGIHGFELCKKVRLNPDLADVKILVMTAVYRDNRYRREAMEAGAHAFLTKPLELGPLNAALQDLVNVDKE